MKNMIMILFFININILANQKIADMNMGCSLDDMIVRKEAVNMAMTEMRRIVLNQLEQQKIEIQPDSLSFFTRFSENNKNIFYIEMSIVSSKGSLLTLIVNKLNTNRSLKFYFNVEQDENIIRDPEGIVVLHDWFCHLNIILVDEYFEVVNQSYDDFSIAEFFPVYHGFTHYSKSIF